MDDFQKYRRGSLANAIAANERSNQKSNIGRVRESWSEYYHVGDFVLCRPYDDRPAMTVEMPMTPERIAEQQAKGSVLVASLTIVGVPSKMVEVLM